MRLTSVLRIIASLLMSVWLVGCATNPPQVSSYSTTTGEPVLVGNYAFWRRDCTPRDFQIKVEQAPTHGVIKIVDGTKIIPSNPAIGSAALCSGKSVASKAVQYTSVDGYIGIDSIQVSISSPGIAGSRAFESRIVVRSQ